MIHFNDHSYKDAAHQHCGQKTEIQNQLGATGYEMAISLFETAYSITSDGSQIYAKRVLLRNVHSRTK